MTKRIKPKYNKSADMSQVRPKSYVQCKVKGYGSSIAVKKAFKKIKIISVLAVTLMMCIGVLIFQSCTKVPVNYTVAEDFITVLKELPKDGTTPLNYSALDNIGYMHYVFKNQPEYYAEMHGTTSAMGINQSVDSYKQKQDGKLIVTEVTSSSMVKGARQFCFVGDKVIWRNSANSNFNGVNTEWSTGSPAGNMDVKNYTYYYGLPGSEFSAYVITEETLLSSTPVVDNGNGTYSFTVSLDVTPKTGAAAYYVKQMVFAGGLNDYPVFDYIKITYTFDEQWRILSTDVNEAYDATMGISVYCTSKFRTEYQYGTEKSANNAYEEYFKNYVNVEGSTGPVESTLSAANCLGEAFASVLTGPTSFKVDVNLGETNLNGNIYLDVSSAMNGGGDLLDQILVRADFGNIKLWLETGVAYLDVNGVKAKLSVQELIGLIADILPSSGEGGSSLDFDSLLADLGGGEFSYVPHEKATLNSNINLLGIDLPLVFSFNLNEQNRPSLEYVKTNLDLKGIDVSLSLSFGNQVINGLSSEQKAEFADVVPVAKTIIDLVKGDAIELGVSANAGDFAVSGNLKLALKELDFNDLLNSLRLSGDIAVEYKNTTKNLGIAVEDGTAYLNVDGIKLKATISEAIEFVKEFLPEPATVDSAEENGLDLEKIIEAVLGETLLKNVTLCQNENIVTVSAKIPEILEELGISLGQFDIGEIELSVDNQTKKITLGANKLGVPVIGELGVNLTLNQTEIFEKVNEEGYADLVSLAKPLVKIFTANAIKADVNFSQGKLAVNGALSLDINRLLVSATLTLSYGSSSIGVNVYYGNEVLYLDVAGLKLKANVLDAIEILTDLLGANQNPLCEQEKDLIESILSLNFGELIEITETSVEDKITYDLLVDANKLLSLLGVNFDLGSVELKVTDNSLSASLLGIDLTVGASDEQVSILSEQDAQKYVDVIPTIKTVLKLVANESLAVSGNVDVEMGSLRLSLEIEKGVISWKNGINVTLVGALIVSTYEIDFSLNVTETEIKLALGSLGVTLEFNQLGSLESSLVSIYNQVYDMVGEMSATENPLPEISGLGDVLSLLDGSVATFETINGLIEKGKQGTLIEHLISSLLLSNNYQQNGLLTALVEGIELSVYDNGENSLSAKVVAEIDGIKLNANLVATENVGTLPKMPDVAYLSAQDFVEIFDYVSALVNTLTQQDVSWTAQVLTTTTDANYVDGKKQLVDIKLDFHSGDLVPLRFNLDDTNFSLSTDLYLHLYLAIIDYSNEEGNDLYFDIWIYDELSDGGLDAIVSVSLFEKTDARYAPLVVTASTKELLSIISSAISLVGLDDGFLHDYIVEEWLTVETADQLEAIGASLLKSINIEELLSSFDFGNSNLNVTDFNNLLNIALDKNDDGSYKQTLKITLNGNSLFGVDGKDLVVVLEKIKDQKGNSLLKVAKVENILANDGAENTSFTISTDYTAIDTTVPIFGASAVRYDVEGVGALLKSLAQSVTHKATEQDIADGRANGKTESVLNRTFYIDGNANLSLSLISIINQDVNIKVIAVSVSVDNDGQVAVNVRLKYDHLKVVYDIINGDTTLDITIKNGMLYMKRTQTTDVDGKALATPEIIYRAMPLSNLASNTTDLLGHIGFMFNLGSDVMDIIKDNVSGSTSTGEKQLVDLGNTVNGIINGFSYEKISELSNKWTMSLNGGALTGDVLGDIVVQILSDENGLIRNLLVNTGISVTGVEVSISANLTYRNPMNVMDSGVRDVTEDVSAVLESAMSKKIAQMEEKGWTDDNGNLTYVEGKLSTIQYFAKGDKIGEQQIVINSSTLEAYADIVYPDTTHLEQKGYTLSWGAMDEYLQISLKYTPNVYDLTFVSERAVDGWTGEGNLTTYGEYVYAQRFELPFASDISHYIVHFVDEQGNVYKTSEDLKNIFEDTTLYAVWEQVDYTVTYTDGINELAKYTLHYGDQLPQIEDPEKLGYKFVGWDTVGTVVGNMTVTAIFDANTYTVTLVSQYEIDGFVQKEDGKYYSEIAFSYDSEVSLPQAIKHEDGYILNGFKIDGEGEQFVYNIPNVTKDTVLVAQWEIIGVDVTFVQENGATVTLNRKIGETITYSELPKINEKIGYSAVWTVNGREIGSEGYVIESEEPISVSVKYTANEYRVKLISDYQIDGYTLNDGRYEKTITYTYNENGVAVELGTPNDVSGYWFKGFYTQKDGNGETANHLSSVANDSTYYAYWQDNTVVVRFYSDIKFDGATYDINSNGYYVERKYNDQYDVGYTVSVTGYQQLGAWWYFDGSAWAQISNVKDLHGKGTISLWALWIQNIKVSITSITHNKVLGNMGTYAIGGEVVGGLPAPNVSKEIYESLGVQRNTMVTYTIYGSGGKNADECGGGQAATVNYDPLTNIGTFNRTDMNSATYSGASASNPIASYGGVKMTMTFALANGTSITCEDNVIVSLSQYTVTFKDSNGAVISSVGGIRLGCSANDYKDSSYIDAIIEKNNIVAPKEEGTFAGWKCNGVVYDNDQLHVLVTGDMELQAVYQSQITLVSDTKIDDGWNLNSQTGKYELSVQMLIGSEITFALPDGSEIKYTVSGTASQNVFDVPSLEAWQSWGSFNVDRNGFTVIAKDGSDFAVLLSTVEFNYNDGQNSATNSKNFKFKFSSNYELGTPTASGYQFLGWWYKGADGKYVQVTTLEFSNGEEVEITLEALWATKVNVSFDSATRSWGTNKATVNVSGGTLVGAFASEVTSGSISYRCWFNSDEGYSAPGNNNANGDSDLTSVVTGYTGVTSTSFSKKMLGRTPKYVHVVANVTYNYNGYVLIVGDNLGSEIGAHGTASIGLTA